MQRFTAHIEKGKTKDVAGFVVPPEVVAALGAGKRPAVKVTLNGYTYRSTVATMSGKFMIGVSKENRKGAGLEGGERLPVQLELDTEPRATEIPKDLQAALVRAKALGAFEKSAPSRRKEFVRQVGEAKAAETRARRIAKIVEALLA
jgi:hypothetical protein